MTDTNPLANKLEGVLSNASVEAISNIVKEQVSAFHNGGLTKADVNLNAERIIATIVADVDGADGKFDHRIDKTVLAAKLKKLEESGLMRQAFGNQIVQKLDEAVRNAPQLKDGSAIDAEALIQQTLRKAEVFVDDTFNKIDRNKDGLISQSDLAGGFQPLPTPSDTKAKPMVR